MPDTTQNPVSYSPQQQFEAKLEQEAEATEVEDPQGSESSNVRL